MCEAFRPQIVRNRIVWTIWQKASDLQSSASLRKHADEYKQASELAEEKQKLI